eukprot:SAG22_NODE_14168_length_382_cov_1.459364_1_plen_50_part_01
MRAVFVCNTARKLAEERHCLRETVPAEAQQKDSALLLRTGLGEHRVGKDG